MDQKDFQEALTRYQSGCATEDEKLMIEKWYEAMERHEGDIQLADETKLEEEYLTAIMRHVEEKKLSQHAPVRKIGWQRYFVGIAASVLLITVSLFIVNKRTSTSKEIAAINASAVVSWREFTNTSSEDQLYTLPDSSRVTLSPNSMIKFSDHFNESVREVQLEGEGFFDVVPNHNVPFLVYADEVTTKVLGTSFTVRSFREDQRVRVAVRTGRVSVYTKPIEVRNNTDEIILTPNQEIIYDRSEKQVSKRIVESPEPIISTEEIERMRFEEAPLKEIFEAIEKIYGVEIEYDEKHFASCILTTSVSGGGLYNRMDIITSAIGAAYELDENRIVVKGPGCN